MSDSIRCFPGWIQRTPRRPQQQYEVFEELEKQAQPLLAQAHELMSKDLPALNEMVNKQNIPAMYVPEGK